MNKIFQLYPQKEIAPKQATKHDCLKSIKRVSGRLYRNMDYLGEPGIDISSAMKECIRQLNHYLKEYEKAPDGTS